MIRVLEKNVADKIAAGEVIERPVSIVKELVENSIDAGADSIVVEIKNGGKSYIRVTDNGCGIPRNEAEVAFLRHATSKIETAKDLNAIETLGFRGEALASIAAVTHTELISKTKEEKIGVKLLIHGSEVLDSSGTGCPDGTTIIITDLFYNTPARQKFLKSDSAESGQIIDFMSQIALAYPNIRFRFINNGNVTFSTTGKGDLLNAILSVYKLSEYKDLVPVSRCDDLGSVTGYISKPSLSRTTRRNQIFFVNGRVVSSKVIERGVTEGYKERLFEGRYPVVFLFIHTDPEKLDVNIHPNKREVRFDDEYQIVELVSTAVKEALGTKAAVIEVKNVFKDETAAPVKREDRAENQVDIKQILSTKRDLPQVKETLAPYQHQAAQSELQPSAKKEHKIPPMQGKTELSIEKPFMQPFDFDELELTGAIFGTYITAVDGKNFYLIDQHAAHERIFYEKLVGEYLSSEKVRQPILTPIIIEVPLSVKENEYDWLDSLTEMGFTVEDFGQNSYVIREIPTFMEITEAEDFVKVYIDNVTEGTNLNNTVVINKLITKSCKSAIKAHDYISMEEMKALLDQLKRCKNPFSCPHGRPTFVKFSQYEIERMFKRA
ncbi:DNA mismatch repair endonuclease MutL [Emergencia timonensis]|uniref:DNA mismatch repair endonuclease MutL n=1 Tax=Emergencia timonensis TaxID=1776384 RepID=UPI003992D1AA